MHAHLITYHSAYNFGSALQAYAMQQALIKLDCPAAIINYRMDEQKAFYQPLYRTKYGVKTWLMDVLQFPCRKERMERMRRFEKFFTDYFVLTPEVRAPEEAAAQWADDDAVISGSDQIWNKHSCELEHNDWKYMDPYLLKGCKGKRISYASSIGNMTDEELALILPELRQFDALAFRETASAARMARLLERPVETVLDPTFLLTKDEWIARLHLKKQKQEKFILAYFLCSARQLCRCLPALSRLAKSQGCRIRLVTPFAYLPYPDRRIEYRPEYGPLEFLEVLYNADAVVTDSYHGTILSVNFGKTFFSVCKSGGAEFRKTDVLNRLGLQARVIRNLSDIPGLPLPPIDYDPVYAKLDALRQHSLNYLKTALEESFAH